MLQAARGEGVEVLVGFAHIFEAADLTGESWHYGGGLVVVLLTTVTASQRAGKQTQAGHSV